jgi:predicted DNA-binding transcriptional regulator YafY
MSFTSDSRTKRLLDLVVVLLDAKQPIPFSELREQFQEYRTAKPEAGLRAFERDKATLLELGVPIRWLGPEEGNDLPPEGGYQIDRQRYRLPEVTLSADEVAALVVTAAAARHQPEFPYRHAAELAVRKLMFDLAGLGGQGRGRGGMPRDVLVHMPSTYRSRSLTEHLGALEEAVRHRKRVTIQYDHHRPQEVGPAGPAGQVGHAGPVGHAGQVGSTPATPAPRPWRAEAPSDGVPQPLAAQSSEKWEVGAPTEGGGPQHSTRDVDPYGLVYRHGAWLLVGHCHVARAVRRFRVDRILDLKVAPRPRTPDFEVPREFSLQEHGSFSPWRFEREPGVAVRLWVSGTMPWVAEEDFGPCSRAPFAGGPLPGAAAGGEALPPGILVDFTCGNLDYLVSRVLGGAGALRVLSPETLRRRIADTAGAVARRLSGLDLR